MCTAIKVTDPTGQWKIPPSPFSNIHISLAISVHFNVVRTSPLWKFYMTWQGYSLKYAKNYDILFQMKQIITSYSANRRSHLPSSLHTSLMIGEDVNIRKQPIENSTRWMYNCIFELNRHSGGKWNSSNTLNHSLINPVYCLNAKVRKSR